MWTKNGEKTLPLVLKQIDRVILEDRSNGYKTSWLDSSHIYAWRNDACD